MKLRNLIFILFMIVLFLFTVVPAQATPIWGSDASAELLGVSRTSPASSGVDATRQWDNGGFTIAWNIVQLPTLLWSYTYTLTAKTKEVSHFILEVTDDDDPFYVYSGTSPLESITPTTWYGKDSVYHLPSNPLMPNDIFGVKFDFGSTEVTYTMVTDRAPVYGVFYVDDGKDGGQDVVAWSNALNYSDYKTKVTDLTFTDFIVRPDSMGMHSGGDPIPEPATLLLLGSGLIGIAVSGKKRFKKRNG